MLLADRMRGRVIGWRIIGLAMKTNELNEPELKPYKGRVSRNGVVLETEYVDWFTDDNDARATYRVIME